MTKIKFFKENIYLNSILTIFVISIIIANVVSAKIIDTGICLFGIRILTPGAVLAYAFTFLATDIVGEVYGKETAVKFVKYGLLGQLFALPLIILTGMLPPLDMAMGNAYNTLLGQNFWIVLGSLSAYLFSQTWDVFVFHGMKDWYVKKYCGNGYNGQGRWIWNNASTITSQFFDTLIFISISFGVGFGFFKDGKFSAFFGMLIGQYCVKVILALLDTPIFYAFTNKRIRTIIEKSLKE